MERRIPIRRHVQRPANLYGLCEVAADRNPPFHSDESYPRRHTLEGVAEPLI